MPKRKSVCTCVCGIDKEREKERKKERKKEGGRYEPKFVCQMRERKLQKNKNNFLQRDSNRCE